MAIWISMLGHKLSDDLYFLFHPNILIWHLLSPYWYTTLSDHQYVRIKSPPKNKRNYVLVIVNWDS